MQYYYVFHFLFSKLVINPVDRTIPQHQILIYLQLIVMFIFTPSTDMTVEIRSNAFYMISMDMTHIFLYLCENCTLIK